jgi:hypothetical protein
MSRVRILRSHLILPPVSFFNGGVYDLVQSGGGHKTTDEMIGLTFVTPVSE